MKAILLSFSFLFFSQICFAQIQQGSRFIGGNVGIGYQSEETGSNGLKNTTFSLRGTPLIGWFISNKWAIGLTTGVSWTQYKQPQSTSYSPFTAGAGDIDRFVPVILTDINNVDYGNISSSDFATSRYYYTQTTATTNYIFAPFIRHYKMFSKKFGLVSNFSVGSVYGKYKRSSDSPYDYDLNSLGLGNGFGRSNYKQETLEIYASYVPRLTYFINERIALEASCVSAYVEYEFEKTGNKKFEGNRLSAGLSFSTGLGLGFKYFWAAQKKESSTDIISSN